MIKRLRKVGNSNALILDKAIMELVGLHEGGEVQLTAHNGSLIVTSASPRGISPERFEASLAAVIEERRSALERLAE